MDKSTKPTTSPHVHLPSLPVPSPILEGFVNQYPSYTSSLLNYLRTAEFNRLDSPPSSSQTYLDYTGSALYPVSLVHHHQKTLGSGVFGNPHSINPASEESSVWERRAREAVLDFVGANEEYELVWTSNATAGMKILGEGFSFGEGDEKGMLLLPIDGHNSLNGLREFARAQGAEVKYFDMFRPSQESRSEYSSKIQNILSQVRESTSEARVKNSLLCLTAQSNVSGLKSPFSSIMPFASSLGFKTFLDGAAYLPTSSLSLSELDSSIDGMVISIYKLFGFPTGVGCLIVKKPLLESFMKPWFCGGTVELVQAPGYVVTYNNGRDRFHDGTPNFLSMMSIPLGCQLLTSILPELGERLPTLVHWTVEEMKKVCHEGSDRKLCEIRSPEWQTGMTLDQLKENYGGLIAFEVIDKKGEFINPGIVELAASLASISIRSGCVCNPGGTSTLMGMTDQMAAWEDGDTQESLMDKCGVRSLGLIRVSFGIASNFDDAWRWIEFLKRLSSKGELDRAQIVWEEKKKSGGHH